MKQRLLQAGIDAHLWYTQFGFRIKRCTEDAIFVARRRIETAIAQRHGAISLLALDWRKAFDSVNLASLLDALRRFGFPDDFISIINGLMRDRSFFVEEFGTRSQQRPQSSGISQGCTLSPLLFLVVMSVLMHDAVQLLGPSARAAYDRGDLADLAYADDTLLLGVSSAHLTEFLDAVATSGRQFGLSLHTDKFQLLQVNCDFPVCLLATSSRRSYFNDFDTAWLRKLPLAVTGHISIILVRNCIGNGP